MSKRMVAFGLIGLGILIIAHHWYTKGVPFEASNLFSHEFFAGLFLALGLGGLLFAS